MTKLIVGLGNPGKEYEKTRHNVGFMFIDEYAKSINKEIKKEKFTGLYADYIHNGEKIILLKPQKYMNLSGEVVKDFVHYFDIKPEDILVISDDLNLELGKIRLRPMGSSGGHNGLKNIEIHLNTDKYKRLRIGISNNNPNNIKDYVLGKFSKKELEVLESKFESVYDIINNISEDSIEKLMSIYNG